MPWLYAPKGGIMAKVKFGLSQHQLGREEKAIVFEATGKSGKLGELHVSSGGLRWYPKSSKKGHHFADWQRFAEIIESKVKKVR